MDLWWIAYSLIVVVSIAGLVGTILISRTQDEKYGTKQNLFRLTAIYAVVILISLVVLAVYIIS